MTLVLEEQVKTVSLDEVVPVGGVLPLDLITAGSSVPNNFKACDGTQVSDAESPIDGETVPDLNTGNRFLRGNTSTGGVGGSAQVSLSLSELPSHSHSYTDYTTHPITVAYANSIDFDHYTDSGSINSGSAGGSGSHENQPQYVDMIFIIRVK